MKLIYPAIIIPFSGKPGYSVRVPDLPGCVTEGYDLANALESGIEAACGWILGELEDGRQIPAASNYSDVSAPGNGFVNLLVLDIDAYAEKYGNKSVRTNITIPAWLKTFGEKNNISFSKVLQYSLMQMAQKQ